MSEEERTLNNLHVLGALSHNDKLCTNDNVFDIYTPTSFRSIMRMWYGERRTQNVQRVRQTIRAAIAFATKSLEDASALYASSTAAAAGPTLQLRMQTILVQHERMCDGLNKASAGLANLRQTYREDTALVSQVNLLITEIEDFQKVMGPHAFMVRTRLRTSPPSSSSSVAFSAPTNSTSNSPVSPPPPLSTVFPPLCLPPSSSPSSAVFSSAASPPWIAPLPPP